MSPKNFREYIVYRVFQFNGFHTVDALLAEIAKANAIQDFSERKHAFNCIAEQAPMREEQASFWLAAYADFPDQLENEMAWLGIFKEQIYVRRGPKHAR